MNTQSQSTVSLRTLLLASIAAVLLACFTMVFFILPAEFGIDPTGVGKRFGLHALHSNHDEQAVADAGGAKPWAGIGYQGSSGFEQFEVEVPANSGVEFKFSMKQYAKMGYEWVSNGPAMYFDLHGEPLGDTTDYYESYSIATANQMRGSFTAPYTGSHGWYWKNTTANPVIVQLKVKGQYVVTGYK